MHVLHYYQQTGDKRSRTEKLFQRLNTFIFAIQLACFIFCVVTFNNAKNMTLDNEYSENVRLNEGVRIKEEMLVMVRNCNTTQKYTKMVDMSRSIYHYRIEINEDNFQYLINELLMHGVYSLIASGVALFFGFINKAAFEFNKHEWIIRSITIYKISFTVLELITIIFALIATYSGESLAEVMRTYIDQCQPEEDNERPGKRSIPFAFPFLPQYIGIGNTILWHIITAVIAVRNGMKKCILDEVEVEYDKFGEPIALRNSKDDNKDKDDISSRAGAGDGVLVVTQDVDVASPVTNRRRMNDVSEGDKQQMMRSYALEKSARKRMLDNPVYYMTNNGRVTQTQVEKLLEHNEYKNRVIPGPQSPVRQSPSYQPRELNAGINTGTGMERYSITHPNTVAPNTPTTNYNDQIFGRTNTFSLGDASNNTMQSQQGNGVRSTTNYFNGVSPVLQPQRRRPPPGTSVYNINNNPYSASGGVSTMPLNAGESYQIQGDHRRHLVSGHDRFAHASTGGARFHGYSSGFDGVQQI